MQTLIEIKQNIQHEQLGHKNKLAILESTLEDLLQKDTQLSNKEQQRNYILDEIRANLEKKHTEFDEKNRINRNLDTDIKNYVLNSNVELARITQNHAKDLSLFENRIRGKVFSTTRDTNLTPTKEDIRRLVKRTVSNLTDLFDAVNKQINAWQKSGATKKSMLMLTQLLKNICSKGEHVSGGIRIRRSNPRNWYQTEYLQVASGSIPERCRKRVTYWETVVQEMPVDVVEFFIEKKERAREELSLNIRSCEADIKRSEKEITKERSKVSSLQKKIASLEKELAEKEASKPMDECEINRIYKEKKDTNQKKIEELKLLEAKLSVDDDSKKKEISELTNQKTELQRKISSTFFFRFIKKYKLQKELKGIDTILLQKNNEVAQIGFFRQENQQLYTNMEIELVDFEKERQRKIQDLRNTITETKRLIVSAKTELADENKKVEANEKLLALETIEVQKLKNYLVRFEDEYLIKEYSENYRIDKYKESLKQTLDKCQKERKDEEILLQKATELLSTVEKMLSDERSNQMAEYDGIHIRLIFGINNGDRVTPRRRQISELISVIREMDIITKAQYLDTFDKALVEDAITIMIENQELFEFEEDHYITITKLRTVGVTKTKIREYLDKVYTYLEKSEFVTVKSMPKEYFIDEIDEFGFDNGIYESILSSDNRITSTSIGNAKVFSIKKITLALIIESYVEKNNGVDITVMMSDLESFYGITITRNMLTAIIRNSTMYFDDILEYLYKDYDSYYEDI